MSVNWIQLYPVMIAFSCFLWLSCFYTRTEENLLFARKPTLSTPNEPSPDTINNFFIVCDRCRCEWNMLMAKCVCFDFFLLEEKLSILSARQHRKQKKKTFLAALPHIDGGRRFPDVRKFATFGVESETFLNRIAGESQRKVFMELSRLW